MKLEIKLHVPVDTVPANRLADMIASCDQCDAWRTSLDEADVIVLYSPTPDELANFLNREQVICVLDIRGPTEKNFQNICYITAGELFEQGGLDKLFECLRSYRVSIGKNPDTGE